jgi:hypothetical protein
MTRKSELRGAKWKATFWKNKYKKLKDSIRPSSRVVRIVVPSRRA